MRENATILEFAFNIVIWILIMMISKRSFTKPFLLKKQELRLLYFYLLIFCIFPFVAGDYFHSMYEFDLIKKGDYSHMEDFYIYLIKDYCSSYHIFRFIVWGSALFLTIFGYRRLNLNNDLVVALLGILFLPFFSYARVTLSMSCIFLGLTYFANPITRNKLFSYIVGLLLIGVSFFFHKSALIGITAAILAIIFNRPSKKIVVCCFLFSPVLFLLVSYLLGQFIQIDSEIIASEGIKNVYLGEDGVDNKRGIGEFVLSTLTRLPLLMIGFTYILSIFKGYSKDYKKSVHLISSYMFFIVLIALLFTLDFGFNTYTLYYRTLNYAIIPSVVFLSQVRMNNHFPKMFKLIMNVTIIGLIYAYLYGIYLSLV